MTGWHGKLDIEDTICNIWKIKQIGERVTVQSTGAQGRS